MINDEYKYKNSPHSVKLYMKSKYKIHFLSLAQGKSPFCHLPKEALETVLHS